MDALPAPTMLWCAVSLAIAGVVKGVTGIGIPLVSISLLTVVISVPQAVVLLAMPIVLGNVWQSFTGGYFVATLRRFWPLLVALTVGMGVGAAALTTVSQSNLLLVIGIAVLVFAGSTLFELKLYVAPRYEAVTGIAAGALGGVLGGMSSMVGPPVIMLLVALGMGKDAFVGTIATIYLLGGVAMSLALAGHRVLDGGDLVWSCLATVPLFAGMLFGQRLRRRVSEPLFRKVLLMLLLLMGLNLIRRALA